MNTPAIGSLDWLWIAAVFPEENHDDQVHRWTGGRTDPLAQASTALVARRDRSTAHLGCARSTDRHGRAQREGLRLPACEGRGHHAAEHGAAWRRLVSGRDLSAVWGSE